MKENWIQGTGIKKHKGALRKQLGIKGTISTKMLNEISGARLGTKVRGHKVTLLLKKRAVLARSLRKF
ncbi:hypothetical protein M0R04_08965 [Candidatus Dojkabacteria bacterium]|jgi:hypothetical protein|nr:hypothetical protein [Candidatus Dojkabacteria bacterium]